MKYAITNKVGGCGFVVYDPKIKDMGICSVRGYVVVNHKHLCVEHLKQTLMVDKNPIMFDLDGKEIFTISKFVREVEINDKIQSC